MKQLPGFNFELSLSLSCGASNKPEESHFSDTDRSTCLLLKNQYLRGKETGFTGSDRTYRVLVPPPNIQVDTEFL